jgi:hypothetical protein
MRLRLLLPAAFALLVGLAAPRAAEAAPVLAVEDTIRLASGSLPEYVVTAKRVTLDEILRRVNEGEERRDSLMRDQVFTRLIKVVYRFDEKDSAKKAVTELDDVRRVYKKKPDLFREIPLRHKTPRKNDDVEIDTNPGMGEQVASFAFEPRTRASFDFTILERKWVGGHVIYKIAFEPKSTLDPLPSGQVWIDTNEYVIVREEFWYRDRSPAPLFLESIDRCVVERQRVDGPWWVITRIFGRIKLAGPVVTLATIGGHKISQTVDFAALYRDWQVNRTLPDSIFAGGQP